MSRAALATAPALPVPTVQEPLVETAATAASDTAESAADRRVHQRHALEGMAQSCKARLKFGPAVTLVDISNGGAQIETTNYRIQPGSVVVLELTGQKGDVAIPATVLRCQLASLLPEPVYRGALVFKRDFDVRSLGTIPTESEVQADLNPAEELAHLRRAIELLAIGGTNGPTPEPALAPLMGALTAAYATLETPAGRRAGPELERELASMFQAVAAALQGTPTPAALQDAIQDHLRLALPCTVGITGHPGAAAPGADAILLSIPRLSPETPVARLSVEFPNGAEPQELHLQILKAGIQFVALARELGRLHGADAPMHVQGPEQLPHGWSQVVACYASGQTRKGFTTEFTPTKGCLELTSEPTPASRALLIPLSELKTIRFVKDPAANVAAEASSKGRKVRVTFGDGQQLHGTTDSYRRSAPGFFVQPLEPQSDDERVFVIGSPANQVIFG